MGLLQHIYVFRYKSFYQKQKKKSWVEQAKNSSLWQKVAKHPRFNISVKQDLPHPTANMYFQAAVNRWNYT